MAKCRLCGNSGLFLRVLDSGLCQGCDEKIRLVIKQNQDLVRNLNKTIQEIDSNQTTEKKLELFAKAIRLCNQLAEAERTNLLTLNEPAEITRNKLVDACEDFVEERRDSINDLSVVKISSFFSDVLKTRSHTCLLQYFLKPRSLTSILQGEWRSAWETVLFEDPRTTIKNLISYGLLKEGDLHDKVAFNLTVTELKRIITQSGNKPIGSKQQLVQQAIDITSTKDLSNLLKNNDIYICTNLGRVLGESFKQAEEIRENNAREEISRLVSSKNFSAAKKVKHEFEALHPWPALFGFSFDIDIPDPNKKSQLEIYKESGVVKAVQIMVPPKACEVCRALDGLIFDIDSAPELPPAGCMCNGKYVSTYLAITETWEELGKRFGIDLSGVDNIGPTIEELAKKYNLSPEQVKRFKKYRNRT